MKKKLKLIIVLIIVLLILFIVVILRKNEQMVKSINKYNAKPLISDEEKQEDIEVGENSKISSIQITKTKTGTGPFDEDDTPGNDSSENNNIVRSFDQITWTVEANMVLKENTVKESYTGGTIEIQAELPENCKGIAEWDLDSMAWAENKNISEDGTIFTANYTMPKIEKTVPGKQTLVLVLKVGGASNGLEITPKISMNLYGNQEQEKQIIEGDRIIVSATPNYNIKLVQSPELQKKLTLDYGKGNTSGRIYGYGIIMQLYNQEASKGIKGIEYPKGEIKFDINLKLTRSKLEDGELEDITNKCTPILWNYKINNTNDYGNIPDRIMYWGNTYHRYASNAPMGEKSNRIYSVYNSGDINMNQKGNIINTSITNYDFDYVFPKCNYYYASHPHNIVEYTENIGCFSVGYFQIFVPDNEESTLEDRNYYLTVSDSNFSATSSSRINTSKQIKEDDDICTIQHVIYKNGNYSHAMTIRDLDYNNPLSSTYESGDAYSSIGSQITLACKFGMNTNNDFDIYGADKFIKFDADCVEPSIFSDGSRYITKEVSYAGTMKFKVYYVTKEDGSNWNDQTEINNANIDNMELYENIEDIPKNKLCIGVFLESESGYLAVSSGDNNTINIPLKVKETATIGKTYEFTQNTKYWLNSLDRNIYTQKKLSGYDTYPNIEWNSGNNNYIKTEYNENGEIIEGTHSGGWQYGQTLLITGADLFINKSAIDEEKGERKTNYDFSKNEYNVTYKLEPTLNNSLNSKINITDVTLKIEDILPKQMNYVAGSSNYSEPEKIKNDDGTTKLIWYIYNVVAGEEIEPIIYQAHIDELTENGTILDNKSIISEVPNTDENGNKIYKIGNIIESKRSSTYSIQTINLSSYSIFKTTKTPIIEKDGEIQYTITCINKTDDALEDFQLLDILPYNGDTRGTEYTGTYKIEKIEINQTSNIDSKVEDNENINTYITENEKVREGITVKDENLAKGDIWEKITLGEQLNKSITALAIVGKLPEKTKIDIDIYLKTEENHQEESYKNIATAQTSKKTEAMQTSIITVNTIKRKIEGIVWNDINKDGLINDGEKLLSGIELKLLKEDDLPAIDIEKNEIPVAITDENGKYYFENMEKGDYKVKINKLDNSKEEITLKEIGINKEINSKFNQDGITDVIYKLNNVDSPILTEQYVNAGIIYKEMPPQNNNYKEKTEENKNNEELEEFNISINKEISKITLNGKEKKVKNGKLEKIELPSKEITNSEIEVEYKIEVENIGNTKVNTIIEEIIPEGFEIVSAENWQKNDENLKYYLEIEPNGKKEIYITLKWNGEEENLGEKNNIVKIEGTNNESGYTEAIKEDNESNAEVIISIKTGIKLRTTAFITTIIAITILLIILIIKKKYIKKYKYII